MWRHISYGLVSTKAMVKRNSHETSLWLVVQRVNYNCSCHLVQLHPIPSNQETLCGWVSLEPSAHHASKELMSGSWQDALRMFQRNGPRVCEA